jgi:hypothetical protein
MHSANGGRDDPSPEPLCDDALTTDGFRTSGRQHLARDRHIDRSFGLLGGKAAGSQPRFGQRLVATHRRFDQRPLAIVGGNPRGQSPAFSDYRQMAVTLCRRTLFAADHGRRARWNHHLDAIAMPCDRLVGWRAIILTVV